MPSAPHTALHTASAVQALIDAALTEDGCASARALLGTMSPAPAVALVSPLQRALQTATLALGSPPACPVLALEACRERSGKNSFDQRRPIEAAQREFPQAQAAARPGAARVGRAA